MERLHDWSESFVCSAMCSIFGNCARAGPCRGREGSAIASGGSEGAHGRRGTLASGGEGRQPSMCLPMHSIRKTPFTTRLRRGGVQHRRFTVTPPASHQERVKQFAPDCTVTC